MSNYRGFLKRSEVVRFASLGASFPVCDVADVDMVVEYEFLNCLGVELYDAMKAKEVDYSSAVAWVAGTTTASTTVSHKGTYWTAIVDTNTEPIAANAFWKLAEKFDSSSCGVLYNEFWCNYLAPYLSFKVAESSAFSNVAQLTGGGLVIKTGDGHAAANSKERSDFFTGLNRKISMSYSNMANYISKHQGCFPSNACSCSSSNACATNSNLWSI